jgi:hypothetical protein
VYISVTCPNKESLVAYWAELVDHVTNGVLDKPKAVAVVSTVPLLKVWRRWVDTTIPRATAAEAANMGSGAYASIGPVHNIERQARCATRLSFLLDTRGFGPLLMTGADTPLLLAGACHTRTCSSVLSPTWTDGLALEALCGAASRQPAGQAKRPQKSDSGSQC